MPRAVEVEDDEDDYRQRAIQNRKEKMGLGRFKLPAGTTTFRILNTPKDPERNSPGVWMEYFMHYNVGAKKAGLRCGVDAVTRKGKCWLCDQVEKLKENDEAAMAAELERKLMYVVQIALYDRAKDELTGPTLWPMNSGKNKSCAFRVTGVISNFDKEVVLDPVEGYNFSITRSGTGLTNSVYDEAIQDEEPSRVPKVILKALKPFVDVLPSYDKELQQRLYFNRTKEDQREGGVAKRRVVEDEDEPVSKKKPRFESEDDDEDTPKKRRKPVVEEDEDDDEGLKYPKDDDDEEDDTPKKRRKPVEDEDDDEPIIKKKKQPVVEEDEEEVEEPVKSRKTRYDEDEDDEPVIKKKKRLDVDEDELEQQDEDDDDDAPVVKKKKPVVEPDEDEEDEPVKKKKSRFEPEDEDEDESDEEEAPKPVKKRR